MRKFFLLVVFTLGIGSENLVFSASNRDREIRELIRFLISDTMLVTSKSASLIPLSFYVGNTEDVARYFGDFTCLPEETCRVVDSLYNNPYPFLPVPYAILGKGLPPQEGTVQEWFAAQSQIERTTIKYGTDIYHAATWQIALALAADNDYLEEKTAQALIENELDSVINPANRATGIFFLYGYQLVIFDFLKAFTYRLVATNYYNKDPFFGGRYQNFISWDFNLFDLAKNDPEGHSPDFFKYVTTWSDWKPLTGENAWAQLIGPLQAEYILTDGEVSASSKAVVNAINTLYAFSAMQTAIGAFYYSPGGTRDTQGEFPIGEISIEDNFSVLAGLQILKGILEKTQRTAEVEHALHLIDVMLNGGMTVNGYETRGLLSFLYNGAFDVQKGVFYTRGSVDKPASKNDWSPDISEALGSMAIDVNLWALSALGVANIDKWYGEGTALNIWRIVRNQGGYFQNNQLWGLGFTLNNRTDFEPDDIMSGENTASAINALQSLIEYYFHLGQDTQELEQDLQSIQNNFFHLRNDEYLSANFVDATPREFFIRLPDEIGQAYLYASRRFPLLFLWNANTLSSTSVTSWVLINKFKFNPLQYAGKFSSEDYPIPVKVDIFDHDNEPDGGALPKTIRVKYTRGNLGPIKKLVISYNLDGSQTKWIVSASTLQNEGIALLPKGAEGIMISFFDSGWANACQIIPARRICKDSACLGTHTIVARWSSSGKGRCALVD
ncbi:hypothetical protein [Legionella jamestowniensis]|uniref:Uncharacterized protein n=1 Tax=Legionella jamestowniensis TaxID=455 RepID=A0A0W0UKT8_9GAMM|nr:hypothetical protein [Legionella jamestowniensis]KTD08246.1 hypothetical protein Ljam_2441 [Legionella jamestowniensis]OCH98568.1 hypothetical protein A8135_00555 [Legionella jamestowniensis]SFL97951.1 hypothetical protein SAMN02746073_2853 [Legionella jamestowniensis DSM 19215]